MLRAGSSRWVFLTPRWAIKVPRPMGWRRFLTGLLANMDERTVSRSGAVALCPVVWAVPGGWLIVMPRTRPLTDVEAGQLDYCGHMEGTGADWEAKASSFGILNGRVVCIDYAPAR